MNNADIKYKGKGEHSISQLEKIIEQREEELHLLKLNPSELLKRNKEMREMIQHLIEWFGKYEESKDEFNPNWIFSEREKQETIIIQAMDLLTLKN